MGVLRGVSVRTWAVTGTVVGILVCLTVSFVIALAFPTPAPERVTVEAARAALVSDQAVEGWRTRVVRAAPFAAAVEGQGLVAQVGLTALLEASPEDVRVRLLAPERRVGGEMEATGSEPPRVLSSAAARVLAAMALGPGASFAPFEAAVRQGDGTWRVAAPKTPWLTAPRLRMGLAFLVVAAVLIPLAALGAGGLTAPFLRLAQAAQGPSDRRAEAFVGGPREAAEAARALDAMRDRLVEGLKDRTAIMAAIAHDLRTPLTGVRLRVEGLAEGPREAAAADIARMERLVAQLLTYVRGEDAAWTLEPLDLADLARDCVTQQAGLGRSVVLEAEGEHLVQGDRDQLERALGNLIDNAVHYGERAVVRVESADGFVRLAVDDAGPGLAVDQLEAVFTPFHRVETSRSRATGGAGLGLAISRSIIERSGGTVVLGNRAGGGLRAEIALPRHPEDAGLQT